MYNKRKRYNKNGYVVVDYPDHHKAFDTGTGIIGVYEHQLIAEKIIDRPLREGEVVHHLDLNRQNNSPDNLLVLSGPMHGKLHSWLDKHEIEPNEAQKERIKMGCVRCKVCEFPISADLIYCSTECSRISVRKFNHPEKEVLKKLLWEKPTRQIAKDFQVSDKTIEKLAKKYNLDKPQRGYWQKIKFEK